MKPVNISDPIQKENLIEMFANEIMTPQAEKELCHLDELFIDAARFVVIHQEGSTSLIQRKLNIGFNKASNILHQLEVAKIVGSFKGEKTREVFYKDLAFFERKLKYINSPIFHIIDHFPLSFDETLIMKFYEENKEEIKTKKLDKIKKIFQRGIYSVEFSEKVKLLENRFHKGEKYEYLQKELDFLTKEFVQKCYRYKIGDIVALKDNCEIEPIDYSIEYCFNKIKFSLIIDYAYDGYDKGLNRLELLEIINKSEHFHHLMKGNYIFQSFYGWTKDWQEKRADHETESYITLPYDLMENRIAYYLRNMVHVTDNGNYQKYNEIKYDITRKVDTQDLYFLRDENSSIKIGISNDVIKRVFDLSSAMNQRIEIIKVINNGGKFERVLHKQFDHLREKRDKKVDGYTEWFISKEELIEFIKTFSPQID